ncbi:hypothetical protein Trydic_g14529 [Trypoxylus dichotomus]
MDVVKLWSSLLANFAIGSSSVCSIPTAYFVQGTADVQYLNYAQNNNNNNDNNESASIVDSDDSDNSCYLGRNKTSDARQEIATFDEEDDADEEEEEEEEDCEDEDDEDNESRYRTDERDRHLVPVRVLEEDIEDGDVSGGDYETTAVDSRQPGRKQTQGKQTQTKIHRNRYSREEYRCSMCPYTCTTEKAFLKHSRTCEPKDENSADTNRKLNLSCPICGKDRNGEELLALHMKKHKDNKHFCCDICKFKTLQLKKLIQHRRMHTGEKPHLCPFCSYRSARRDNLRSHARRVHKKDNLPCDTFTPRSMILRPSKSK